MVRSVADWARSALGRSIALYKSEENPHRPILWIGGVHGDEPEGVALADATLEWLKSNSARCVVPWVVIPCLNPDGYSVRRRTNGNGVDLNRNYPAKSWSPHSTSERYHPGPSPGSEPEIQALVRLINEVKPRLLVHCHSWNPCIVYAGEAALPFASVLGQASSYEVRDDIGYPTPGSLSQYGWADNGIPVICIEAQENSVLDEVWPRFAAGVESIFTNSTLHSQPLKTKAQ